LIKDIGRNRNSHEEAQYINNYDNSSKLSNENVTTKQYTSEIPSNYDYIKENSYPKRAISHSYNQDSTSNQKNNMFDANEMSSYIAPENIDQFKNNHYRVKSGLDYIRYHKKFNEQF